MGLTLVGGSNSNSESDSEFLKKCFGMMISKSKPDSIFDSLKKIFIRTDTSREFNPGDLVELKDPSLANNRFLPTGEKAIVLRYVADTPYKFQNANLVEQFDIVLGIKITKERYVDLLGEEFDGDPSLGYGFFEHIFDSRRLKLAE